MIKKASKKETNINLVINNCKQSSHLSISFTTKMAMQSKPIKSGGQSSRTCREIIRDCSLRRN